MPKGTTPFKLTTDGGEHVGEMSIVWVSPDDEFRTEHPFKVDKCSSTGDPSEPTIEVQFSCQDWCCTPLQLKERSTWAVTYYGDSKSTSGVQTHTSRNCGNKILW
ncbi:hypothetical protein I302_106612 [Kwoniella bestiolae CBS 10118]|uniref:Uncharacterized protein n=1 Tax=Kwoniella bestiolae CBS 10118 TaxID=1296100 RepID=A0A1B9G0W6_9TREE|nr:hypothetical protein I302_06126 [Kwoniella bestiolae CBS 10118]OCF24665.1 hypothetical protein I302_06126 [Kwoniella bestiolae CBS 10118]